MTLRKIAAVTVLLMQLAAPPVQAEGLAGAYLAGRQARYSGDYQAAADYFTQALARDPGNPSLMEATVVSFLSLGRIDRALPVATAMEEQGEDPLDAADLAAIAGISVRQMERLFRSELKERPMGLYQKLRLEKAERLLTYSPMSVREIAVACGFSSLPLFSRSFRARYGKPPSALRKG